MQSFIIAGCRRIDSSIKPNQNCAQGNYGSGHKLRSIILTFFINQILTGGGGADQPPLSILSITNLAVFSVDTAKGWLVGFS